MNGSGVYNVDSTATVQPTNNMLPSMENGRETETLLLTNNNNNNININNNNNNNAAMSSTKSQKADAHKSCPCLSPRVLLLTFLFLLFSAICSLYLYNVITVCSSKECIVSTARLLTNLDTSIDPCTDFYEYACGSWMNRTANLNYVNGWNTLFSVNFANHDRIVKAVYKHAREDLPYDLNKGELGVIQVFQQCADADTIAKIGTEPVDEMRKQFGGWMPDLDVDRERRSLDDTVYDMEEDNPLYLLFKNGAERLRRETLAEPLEDLLLRYFNLSVFPLFFAGVQVNYRKSSEYIITIYEQVPLLFDSKAYLLGPEPIVEDLLSGKGPHAPNLNFLQVIGQEMAELFGENQEGYKQRLAEMIILEWKIANCTPMETDLPNSNYAVITLAELQRNAPMINWRYFLSGITKLDLSIDEKIALKSGIDWMQQLSRIIEEYNSSFEKQMILRSYMKWKVLVFFLSYTRPQCETQHLWTFLTYYSGPRHLRKEYCMMRLSGLFPLSLASLARKIDGEETIDKNREMVLKMSETIREEMFNEWNNSPMLDEQTRMNVLYKIKNMSILSSYPEKIVDQEAMEAEASRVGATFFESIVVGVASVYHATLKRLRQPVDKKDWLDTRPALSAIPVHNYERNLVLVPMDALHAPIADFNQLDSLNYGAIGSYVGHEMSHAFDAEGKQHGPTGNLALRQYWTLGSTKKYEEVISCLVDHYANLSGSIDHAIRSRYENIADVMGLETSYKAWKRNGNDRWIKAGGINPDQRFFLSFAQSWCALENSANQPTLHSKERIRVMGSLKNSKAFASAFQCPAGSPMNPITKCDLW